MSRWTTVDQVLALEPGKSARGMRNVPNTLAILDSHFPRFPVLPGVLILGSLGELAALLLYEGTARRWKLAGAEQIRFRHWVQPGDQMELEVEIKEASDEQVLLKGTARVGGKPITTVRSLRLVPQTSGGAA